METNTVHINVPKKDMTFLRKLAANMGWTIRTQRKSGIEKALEDVAAGRVYSAKDADDLIRQILG